MIRIAIYGAASVQASGLGTALNGDGNFELLAVCASIGGLLTVIAQEQPDIILIEPTREANSVVLREVHRQAPGARIVLWVDKLSAAMAMEAMVMGMRGVLRKSLPAGLQLSCLRRVHAGELWFEKAITGRMTEPRGVALTPGEQSLLELLSGGLKDREIASRLAMSEGEVKVYLSRLFQKFGVKDRFELALLSLKKTGWRRDEATRAFRAGISEGPSGEVSEGVTMPMLPTLQ